MADAAPLQKNSQWGRVNHFVSHLISKARETSASLAAAGAILIL